MDVLDKGRMGLFADPSGAVFGVWQPGVHKGALLVNEPNTFTWSELVTTDVEAAKAFYGAVFDWGAHDQGDDAHRYNRVAGSGGASVGGMMAKPAEMPAEVPSFWGVLLRGGRRRRDGDQDRCAGGHGGDGPRGYRAGPVRGGQPIPQAPCSRPSPSIPPSRCPDERPDERRGERREGGGRRHYDREGPRSAGGHHRRKGLPPMSDVFGLPTGQAGGLGWRAPPMPASPTRN